MLFGGFTPIYAAAWAIISTVVVAMFRKRTRMTFKSIAQALEEGTRAALGVAMACAMVGLIVGVASLTGFGLKMTSAIRSEEHTSELQSRGHLVCRLLLEKKNKMKTPDADYHIPAKRSDTAVQHSVSIVVRER